MANTLLKKRIEKDDNILKFLMALYIETNNGYTKVNYQEMADKFKVPYDIKKILIANETIKELKPLSNILYWKGDYPNERLVENINYKLDINKKIKKSNKLFEMKFEKEKGSKKLVPLNKIIKYSSTEQKYFDFLTALKEECSKKDFKFVNFCKIWRIGGPTRQAVVRNKIIIRTHGDRGRIYKWNPNYEVNKKTVALLFEGNKKTKTIAASKKNTNDSLVKLNIAKMLIDLGEFKDAEKLLKKLVNNGI
jgi:hypothetical protein